MTETGPMLPLRWPWELEELPRERRWLVDHLWLDQGVGIIGGEPKCCKSFLALELAVAVASGSACLRRFAVSQSAHVMYFAAEDASHIVRSRLEGICATTQLGLRDLKLQLITSPSLRLDLPDDIMRLDRTLSALRPKLLILDPFVRLHRIDENNSGEVAPILAHLRLLQRTYGVAIMLVHHSKKGASSARAGQALRGSSEFHAWGDCNLYLRRDSKENLTLSVEHRAEASIAGIPLRLQVEGSAPSLQLDPARATDDPHGVLDPLNATASVIKPPKPNPHEDQILKVLKEAKGPLTVRALRDACEIRTATVCATVQSLIKLGQVSSSDQGYSAL